MEEQQKEFKSTYEKLKGEGAKSLIIDIRGNGGGVCRRIN